jgi:hypothetical protein
MFSDRNAKQNIVKIGQLDNGLNLYKFEYIDAMKDIAGHGEFIGCMADEVEHVFPEAVLMDDIGYKKVNYEVIYG